MNSIGQNATVGNLYATTLNTLDTTGASNYKYTIEQNGNQFEIVFDQGPRIPLSMNSFGWLTLDGAQARVQFSSTTAGSGDYYYIGCGGISGGGYLNINYYNALTDTIVNPFNLSSEGLLWLGATNQTEVGLKLSDRANTNQWTMYADTNALTFEFSGAVKIPFKCFGAGQFQIAGTAAGIALFDRSTVNSWTLYSDANVLYNMFNSSVISYTTTTGTSVLLHGTGTANGTYYFNCQFNAVSIGGIRQLTTSSTEFFNGVSDYRAKKNISPVLEEQSGKAFDALKPVNFEYIAEDDYKTCGFIAHELQEVIPHAVFGTKDAVNEDGTPDYQSVSVASQELITLMVAEIQFIRKRMKTQEVLIKELSARIALLEAK